MTTRSDSRRTLMPQARGEWRHSFLITNSRVPAAELGEIVLGQQGPNSFRLHSRVEFTGGTGLGGELDTATIDQLRIVEPDDLADTDLASVPSILRWFVNTYGGHTAAALIHDRWIPVAESPLAGVVSDVQVDTYFRHMLAAVGERWLRRWLMWAAVAYRTRLTTRPATVIVWTVGALFGVAGLLVGLVTSNVPLVIATAVAPLPFSLLWSGQYRAGLVAAVSVPFLVPPVIAVLLGLGLYLTLEAAAGVAGFLLPGTHQREANPSPTLSTTTTKSQETTT